MSLVKFSSEHEWIRIDGDSATIGITDYAQEQLGDVVYVEPPEVGQSFAAGENVGVVESVKAVGEIYMPLSGTISATNEKLEDEPELVNTAPMADGWLFKITMNDPNDVAQLMEEADYLKYIASL